MAYRTRNITFYRRGPGSIPGVGKNNFLYTTVYVVELQEFLRVPPGGKGWSLDSFYLLAEY